MIFISAWVEKTDFCRKCYLMLKRERANTFDAYIGNLVCTAKMNSGRRAIKDKIAGEFNIYNIDITGMI